MGNTIFRQRMVIERLITNKPYHICLGVIGKAESDVNPYKEQVIRVGEDGILRSMVSFQETDQFIHFQFEGDIHLKFMRRDDEIVYFLSTPDMNITDKVLPIIRRQENIGLRTPELDRLFNFLRIGMNIEQQ
jgi:hypothetical protein